MPVIDAVLPLLVGLPSAQDFYRNLRTEDGYLNQVKGQMDGMLLATGQPDRLKDFAGLLSDS
jgi:hypothetical protein